MKCPYYDVFSSPKAALDMGDDCVESACVYWWQLRGETGCGIKDRDEAKRIVSGEMYTYEGR